MRYLFLMLAFSICVSIQKSQAYIRYNDEIKKGYNQYKKEDKTKTPLKYVAHLMDEQRDMFLDRRYEAGTVLSIFGTMGPFGPGKSLGPAYTSAEEYCTEKKILATKTIKEALILAGAKKQNTIEEDKKEFSRLFNLKKVSEELAGTKTYQTHIGALWVLYQTYFDVPVKNVSALGDVTLGKENVTINDDGKNTIRQEAFKKMLGGTDHLNGLSPKLKKEIRSYLDRKDRAILKSVNKGWHKLSTNDRKWMNIYLDKLTSIEDLKKRLEKSQDIEWMKIEGGYLPDSITINDVIVAIGKKMGEKLKGLYISNTFVDVKVGHNPHNDLGDKGEFLKDFKTLKFLKIDYLSHKLIKDITTMENLKTLKLFPLWREQEYGALIQSALTDDNFQLTNLNYLELWIYDYNLRGRSLSDNFLSVILPSTLPKEITENFLNNLITKNLSQLKTITIHRGVNDDNIVKRFLSLLKSSELLKQLESIKFDNIDVSSDYIKELESNTLKEIVLFNKDQDDINNQGFTGANKNIKIRPYEEYPDIDYNYNEYDYSWLTVFPKLQRPLLFRY